MNSQQQIYRLTPFFETVEITINGLLYYAYTLKVVLNFDIRESIEVFFNSDYNLYIRFGPRSGRWS